MKPLSEEICFVGTCFYTCSMLMVVAMSTHCDKILIFFLDRNISCRLLIDKYYVKTYWRLLYSLNFESVNLTDVKSDYFLFHSIIFLFLLLTNYFSILLVKSSNLRTWCYFFVEEKNTKAMPLTLAELSFLLEDT